MKNMTTCEVVELILALRGKVDIVLRPYLLVRIDFIDINPRYPSVEFQFVHSSMTAYGFNPL